MSRKNEEKIREAIALKYSPEEDKAPTIVAMGKGISAEKIIEAASQNDVPVYENAGLTSALGKMNIGDEIPSELYELVAEVLIFISNLDKNYGEKYGEYIKK